jgi:hypothetical protein
MRCFATLPGHVFSCILECMADQVFEEAIKRHGLPFAQPRSSEDVICRTYHGDRFRKPGQFTTTILTALLTWRPAEVKSLVK